MKTYKNLYSELCSYDNLFLAYRKARKRKTLKPYVIEFEKNLKDNLLQLRTGLLLHSYKPEPLKTFILRDPKTRKISKSEFKDGVVHHALCNIIQPILEKRFIHDSYANQIGKGTLAAIKRFEIFKRKVSRNHTKIKDAKNIKGFVLKGDVKQFFDSVNHDILIKIIERTIKDYRVIWLIRVILSNHKGKLKDIGMPLGNLTSQFFANVYLNELDYFVKHKLRAHYYIRYVDDFVILHQSREVLEEYKQEIDDYLDWKLFLRLHPEKSKIFSLYRGTDFLGLRIFPNHKTIKKKNIRKFKNKLRLLRNKYQIGIINYDKIYDFLEGWCAYIQHTDSYKLKKKMLKPIEKMINAEISTKEINRYLKEQNMLRLNRY